MHDAPPILAAAVADAAEAVLHWVGKCAARAERDGRGSAAGRAAIEGRVVHIPDARLIQSTYANRSLLHANRVSGRAFAADRETDFGRQRRRAPIRFRTVFVPRRDRERAMTPRPKPRKIEGVPRRRGNSG
jgi:hypothetical protein